MKHRLYIYSINNQTKHHSHEKSTDIHELPNKNKGW
jgi:hypothetical protein